jgi:hypothetical protein
MAFLDDVLVGIKTVTDATGGSDVPVNAKSRHLRISGDGVAVAGSDDAIDLIIEGADAPRAKVAATTNLTLAGTQTIDGVSCGVGDVVLTVAQTSASENRLWVVQSGSWTPAPEMTNSSQLKAGMLVSVRLGTTNAATIWQLASSGPFTLGVTALVWAQVAGSGGTSAGTIQPVDVALTSNDSLSGLTTRDDVSLTAGMRALATAQTSAAQNGVYTVAAGAWVRAADCDADGDLRIGQQIRVKSGTLGAGTIWELASGTTLAGSKTYQRLPDNADRTYIATRKPVVINVNEPNGSGVVLKGDGTDERTNILAIFAYAATVAATPLDVVLSFKNGTYVGFDNVEVPQFCSLDLNGAVLVRPANYGPGDVLRHTSYLNVGQPSESWVYGGTIRNEAIGGTTTVWQPSHTFAVNQYVIPKDLIPHMTGTPTLTFNAAARTMVRSSGSWIRDFFTLSQTNGIASITGTASNNLTNAPIASITATTITFTAAVTIVDEVGVANCRVIGAPAVVRFNTPTSHSLKCISNSGPTGAHMAIGELSKFEWGLGVQLRGTAEADHDIRVQITEAGALGTFKFQVSLDGGVSYGTVQTAANFSSFDPKIGAEYTLPGQTTGDLRIYFPYRPAGFYTLGLVITPTPRIEILGVPPSDQTLVDVKIITAGVLGTMQFKLGFAYAPTVDKHLLGGGTDTTTPSTITSTAGAPYYDYAIPGTSLTARFHAGNYTASGSTPTYWTPACHHSIIEGSKIVDGGHTWQVMRPSAGVNFTGMGNVTYDHVRFYFGNFNVLINQAENVTLKNCTFYSAAGAAWYCANDGTITPGAAGGFTNTINIEGRTIVSNEVYGGVHDGGYTYNVSGCATFQRAQRGMHFIRGLVTGKLGPGVYCETAGVFIRDSACFSRIGKQGAFDGLSFDNVLLLGSGYASIDIVCGTARGLKVGSGSRVTGTYGISGLTAVDDVHIDESVTHHTRGVLIEDRPRHRHRVVKNSVVVADMPIAYGVGASKTIALGTNNDVAWPTDSLSGAPAPKALMHLGLGAGAGIYRITGFAAGEEGQILRVEHNAQGAILEIADGTGSSAANRTHTRRAASVYLYGPATPGHVVWAEFIYLFTGGAFAGWYLLGHSKAYNDSQSGTTTLVAGVSPAISAYLTSSSVITAMLKSRANGSATAGYVALAADVTTGAPGTGTFKLSALSNAAGDNTVNTSDTSTLYWTVTEPG